MQFQIFYLFFSFFTTGKGGDKESDNVSQSSFGSQVSEEAKLDEDPQTDQEEVDDVLRRAEEALTSVDSLLKGHGDKGDKAGHPKSGIARHSETEDSVVCKAGDQTDSASDVASSETLVEGSASKDGLGAGLDTQTAGSASPAKSKSKKEGTGVHVAGVIQAAKDPCDADSTVQSSSAKAVPLSPRASVQSPGDPVVQPSATAGAGAPRGAASAAGEDPLEAAEKTLDSMTRYYKVPVKKEDSVDDFYSKFSPPYSPTDPFESPSYTSEEHRSFSDFECGAAPDEERKVSTSSAGSGAEKSAPPETMLHKLANSWSEFTAPANIYSLSLSSTHVWFTDKGETLYYSALGGVKGILWRKVREPANQISVSPSGHIVWRLYRGRVFAGTKITQRRPEGLKWVEAVRDVAHISVDDHCAW